MLIEKRIAQYTLKDHKRKVWVAYLSRVINSSAIRAFDTSIISQTYTFFFVFFIFPTDYYKSESIETFDSTLSLAPIQP